MNKDQFKPQRASLTLPFNWASEALEVISECFRINDLPSMLIDHGITSGADEVVIFQGLGRNPGTMALFYKDGDISEKLHIQTDGYHYALVSQFQLDFDFGLLHGKQFRQAEFNGHKICVGIANVKKDGDILFVSEDRDGSSGLVIVKLR